MNKKNNGEAKHDALTAESSSGAMESLIIDEVNPAILDLLEEQRNRFNPVRFSKERKHTAVPEDNGEAKHKAGDDNKTKIKPIDYNADYSDLVSIMDTIAGLRKNATEAILTKQKAEGESKTKKEGMG